MYRCRTILFAVCFVVCCRANTRAQDPPKDDTPQPAAVSVTDLSTRFRFIERYAVEPVRAKPEFLGQYQVAIRETIKLATEKKQGAPERTESGFHTIFTERPAKIGIGGEVVDAVRHYDAFRALPDRSKPGDAIPLEGLTLWFHPRPGKAPQILCVDDKRSLRETEFTIASHQVFLPELRGLLPPASLPVRISDPWRISRSATQSLVADPSAEGPGLVGKLLEIREEKGAVPQWVAVISATGRMNLVTTGKTTINAEILFSFTPPATPTATGTPKSQPAPAKNSGSQSREPMVDAFGSISELRMTLSAAFPASPDPNERLRRLLTREYIVQRRVSAEGSPRLPIPSPAPQPTEANSWVIYSSPDAPKAPRFTFRHPQELFVPPDTPAGVDYVGLIDRFPQPRDVITVQVQWKSGKPEADRASRDPESHRKDLLEEWAKERLDVIQGPSGWLPEADWAPAKMKVYRFEAVLKGTTRETRSAPRRSYNFYLVLFGRDESLVFTAQTEQDPPTAFRKQAEAILKSFRFDPPK